jgi:hypothetical protein
VSADAGTLLSKEHKLQRVQRLAREALQGADLADRCAAAGYAWGPAGARIRFLDTELVLEPDAARLYRDDPGGDAGDASAALERRLSEEIVLLHYLARTPGRPPAGRWVGFDQLPGGAFYGGTFRLRAEAPLARAFGADPRRLLEAAAGMDAGAAAYGDAALVVPALPRVPLLIVVWRGDDEIAANAKVLFDADAEAHLLTEDLVVLGEIVTRRLRRGTYVTGGETPCPGS